MSSTRTDGLPNVYRKTGTRRSRLRLGQCLGSSGEGAVYEVASRTSHVVKLYSKPSDYRHLKLEAMLRAVPEDPPRIKRKHVSICWPEEIVFSAAKAMVGFLMPRLNDSINQKVAICWDPHDRAEFFPRFTWRDLCVAAANIASVVDLLHDQGHVVGDLNDENVLVNDQALVTLINCDSMQVRDPESGDIFRCEAASPEYLAPEVLPKGMKAIDRTFQHDYWALAVLVFKMLMEGHHPASGVGPIDGIGQRVKAGIFPLLGAAGWEPPKNAPTFSMLPEGLQRLFERCFHDGHRQPESRPTSADWQKELQRVEASINQCEEELKQTMIRAKTRTSLKSVHRKTSVKRSQLRLGHCLGSGGEGLVYEVASRTSHVVKLYRKPSDYRRLKLEAMLRAVPDDPQRIKRQHVSICWPEELVLAADKSMAGFLMPRLDKNTHQKVAICWDPHDCAQYFPGFTWRYLCVAAANVASVVELIHRQGHVIGDLNDENFLVNNQALVTLIDCDSIQVRDPESGELFRCAVARPEYLAPEALSKDLEAIDRTFQHDYWALAVLVFKMLMVGHHPTSGIGPIDEPLEKKVKAGIFPFFGAERWMPPKRAPPVSMLPDGVQRLFERCFHDGHRRPELRPTAADWRKELNRVVASLIQCPRDVLHWYAPHVTHCPWCQHKQIIESNHLAIRNDNHSGPAATSIPSTDGPSITDNLISNFWLVVIPLIVVFMILFSILQVLF